MKESLLEYLCCPNCQNDFQMLVENKINEEVEDGKLICNICKIQYPIVKSIPIIIKGDLEDLVKTKSNWENWWEKVREKSDIDLYDKLWIQAEKNLGGEPLYRPEDFEGKIVLDAGCGNGRHIASDFAKFQCREIIAMDLGKQVFEAKELNKNLNNVHYIQADLTNPPLKKECIDVIASHGVLHHTPNPKKTFQTLAKALKIDGMMAIYVYHKEWQHFAIHRKSLLLDALYANGVLIWQGIRKLTSRLPYVLLIGWCYIMAAKATVEYTLQQKPATKPLGKFLQLIPPFAYIGVNFHERLVRNYDHYSATYNYFQTTEEVIDWYESANFDELDIVSVPVSVRGRKQSTKPDKIRIKKYPLLGHFEFRQEWERLFKELNKN